MGKLLVDFGIKQQLIDRIRGGMPVWGTCAGAILLANQIQDEDYVHLSVMNMEVRRNAYGGQLDSFTSNTTFPDVSKAGQWDKFITRSDHSFPTVFIRAPIIEAVGEDCKILGRHQGKIIVQENNMLATTFHPELMKDSRFHGYFASMVIGALGVV
jgi:5'-phosphate synthase pdxT subunit